MAAQAPPARAVVYDFDWSLINENSDYWVPAQLDAGLMEYIHQRQGSVQFTALMADVAGQLHARGFSRAQIEDALARIPVYDECVQSLRLAKARGSRVYIVSDANTVYIETVLRARGVAAQVDAIVTNAARFDSEGRLLIAYVAGRGGRGAGPILTKPAHVLRGLRTVVVISTSTRLRPSRPLSPRRPAGPTTRLTLRTAARAAP
jgi:pyridoxal phosphate phosphatase PHOSPHO2